MSQQLASQNLPLNIQIHLYASKVCFIKRTNERLRAARTPTVKLWHSTPHKCNLHSIQEGAANRYFYELALLHSFTCLHMHVLVRVSCAKPQTVLYILYVRRHKFPYVHTHQKQQCRLKKLLQARAVVKFALITRNRVTA